MRPLTLIFLNLLALMPGAKADDAEKSAVIESLFLKHCVHCHGKDSPEGGLSLIDLNYQVDTASGRNQWLRIRDVLQNNEMPPEKEPRPSDLVRQRMIDWINRHLERNGELLENLNAFDFSAGNLVDHSELFSGEHKGPAFTQARLWRIRPQISSAAYADNLFFGRSLQNASQPFTLTAEPGIKDYAFSGKLDTATLELLLLNASELVSNLLGPSPDALEAMDREHLEKVNQSKLDELAKRHAAGLLPSIPFKHRINDRLHKMAYRQQSLSKEESENIVSDFYHWALQRQPGDEELRHAAGELEGIANEVGNHEALTTVLTGILVSPEAIYRLELGLSSPEPDGRRMLSPFEIACAVNYALRDQRPDQALLADAKNGSLAKREVIASHVDRLWKKELAGEASQIIRFFREFFGYDQAPNVFKDRSRLEGYQPRPYRLVEDTDALIRHILSSDKNVLRQLLITDEVAIYVNPHDFRWTHEAYDVSRENAALKSRQKDRPANLNERGIFAMPGKRAGILTQPSWLMAHSDNFDNDPVKRGRWIYERLLAGSVPSTPVTVDATVPNSPDQTLRQRLTKTREKACWNCHQKMDPLGLPFEQYDDVGRFRTKELLRDYQTKVPLQIHSEIDIENFGPAYRVKGPIDLLHKLTDRERVRQSFVRHAFRFWMGRNESLIDSPTLIAADRAFVESGGSMKTLVRSIVLSDSFLYRKN